MGVRYTVSVKSEFDRRAEIAAAVAANPQMRPFHQMSRPEPLPLITVDIHSLIYRMGNGRTKTRQREAISQHQLAENHFTAHQEDASAQQTQHEFLVDLANTSKGDSIQAISEALARTRTQTEPLLILRSGVVLNGNRRLAAMRELFTDKPGLYSSFALVEVLVLPESIDAKEEKRIETRLQMARETRLPYDWISQAIVVNEMRDSGMTDKEIADLMQLQTVAEVSFIVERLTEADIYLAEVVGRPGAYTEVLGGAQHFEEMAKRISAKQGADQEVSRKIAHVIQREPKVFGSRVYDFREAFGRDSTEIVAELADRFSIDIDTVPTPGNDDLFSGTPDPNAKWLKIIPLLEDKGRGQEIAEAIRDIEDEIIESRRQSANEKAALSRLRKVSTQLATLNFDGAATETYPHLRSQLDTISVEVERLSTDIDRRTAEVGAGPS